MSTHVVRLLVCLQLGSILPAFNPWVTTATLTAPMPVATQSAPAGSQTLAFAVTIHATDANTQQPLKSFRVVPTPYNVNGKQVTWQSQYLTDFQSVPATCELQRGWQQTLLRIEAEGYRPIVTEPLAKKVDMVLNVALQPDAGIAGQVLTPDGKPAAGATVAVCTWTNEVTVRDGKLAYGHHAERLRGLARTADDGSFRVPAEVDEWVLVVAHQSGYAERTAAELARQSTVTLQSWGRLEGEFVLDGKPVADQPVSIGAGRGDVQVVLHYSASETNTDADGKFTADHLPPVNIYVTPQFKQGEASFNLLWFSGLTEIKSGEVTCIRLPRPGQIVTGRLTLPQESGVSMDEVELGLSIVLRPPSVSGVGPQVDQNFAAYAKFMQSDLGTSFRREGIPIESDGHFRIEGLPETDYVLQATAFQKSATPNAERGKAIASCSSRVHVPASDDTTESVQLGDLPLKPYHVAQPLTR